MSFNYNNPPLATIIHGNLTIETGSDVTQFGFGDLNVQRRGNFYGTENATNATTGAVTVYGGIGIVEDVWIDTDLTTLGLTKLKSTFIDTSVNGGLSVTGANAVNISVGTTSNFTVTGGNLALSSTTERLQLSAGKNDDNAITLTAIDIAGGINLLSGTSSGRIQLVSGSGGIQETTSNGNLVLTANNASGEFTVNTQSANQNLELGITGSTDSQVLIESSGVNTTLDAIEINTTNTAGNILVQTANGLGAGSITFNVGSGGYQVTTNTGGTILLTAQAAQTEIKNLTSNANDNLIINLENATDSSLIIKSQGTSATKDAIAIFTTNTGGNIHIYNTTGSAGYIHANAGSGGYQVTTAAGGTIEQTANGAVSTYENITTSNGQDLNIYVTGGTLSKLNIVSDGTGNDAINIQSVAATGGIFVSAQGTLELRSNNSVEGIKIGTNNNVPIQIGGATSTTTIYGNLNVQGVTTSVESTVVTIDDNILFINNAPGGLSDGGMGIKRYQFANDVAGGEVINDTPEETGTAQAGTLTTITLAAGASGVTDFYAGWWIEITAGTGANQVRRINTYNGTTKVATIYTTADQTGVLNNPSPVEGLDFTTAPDATSVYALYPCYYILSIWDESLNEYSLVCTPLSPGSGSAVFTHYIDFHVNDITANNLTVNTINGTTADTTILVNLIDNSTTPVSITNFGATYGTYMVLVKPTSLTTGPHAVFSLTRINNAANTGQVVRLVSARGDNSEQLDMSWPANTFPTLQYRPAPGGAGANVSFTLRLITV